MIRQFLISIDLPKWARWYAVDKDGEVNVFSHKPEMYKEGPFPRWALLVPGSWLQIAQIYYFPDGWDWTKTLHKIDRAA